jgi:hypothetical protein
MTTDASNATTGAGGKAISLVRWLVVINLGFVALQALSAGLPHVWIRAGPEGPRDRRGCVAVRRTHPSCRRRRAVAATPSTDLGGGRQYRAVRDCVSSGRVRLPEVVLASRANWRRHLRRADATSPQAGDTVAYDLTAEPAARRSKRPGGDRNSGKTESNMHDPTALVNKEHQHKQQAAGGGRREKKSAAASWRTPQLSFRRSIGTRREARSITYTVNTSPSRATSRLPW